MRHLLEPNPRRARDSACSNHAACNMLNPACSAATACTQQDARMQHARAEPHSAHRAPCRDRRPNFSAPLAPRAAPDPMLHFSLCAALDTFALAPTLALCATSGARLQGRPSRRVFARRPCSRCPRRDPSLTHRATNINARLCRKRYKREPSFAEGLCPQAPSSQSRLLARGLATEPCRSPRRLATQAGPLQGLATDQLPTNLRPAPRRRTGFEQLAVAPGR